MIKSVLSEEGRPSEEWDYPCLAICHNDDVVLFTEQSRGTTVNITKASSSSLVVYHSDHFDVLRQAIQRHSGA